MWLDMDLPARAITMRAGIKNAVIFLGQPHKTLQWITEC
jgi:hypothetical protein